MTAIAYWNALAELRHRYQELGATDQARIHLLVASVSSAPPPLQRESMRTLIAVADSTDHLRCLLQALLPPEISEA